MELNAVDRCQFGYVNQSVNSRSRSANNTCIEQRMSLCKVKKGNDQELI